MSSDALDSLFQQADQLKPPVEISVNFYAVGLGMGQGAMFYTKRSVTPEGKREFVQAAFFKGVITPDQIGSQPSTVTLTAPLDVGLEVNYRLTVASPTLNVSFTPIDIPLVNNLWRAYGTPQVAGKPVYVMLTVLKGPFTGEQ